MLKSNQENAIKDLGKMLGFSILDEKYCKIYGDDVIALKLNSLGLEELPETFSEFNSLVYLDLEKNSLEKIPTKLYKLKNLKVLKLEGNPLDKNEKKIIKNTIPVIFEYLKKKVAINIFVSHVIEDYEIFRLSKFAEYLEPQDEIYKVYVCEEDLVGNIDWFMKEIIPQCDLVIFIGSKRAVFNSPECIFELNVARDHGIQIIPIKGKDISWNDLKTLDLEREMGFEFNIERFDELCTEVYDYICQFKKKIDIIDKGKIKYDRIKLEVNNILNFYLKSELYDEIFKKNFKEISILKQDYKANNIELDLFLEKFFKLLVFKRSKYHGK